MYFLDEKHKVNVDQIFDLWAMSNRKAEARERKNGAGFAYSQLPCEILQE